MKRIGILAGGAVLLAVAACSSGNTGFPVPATSATSGGDGSSGSQDTTSAGGTKIASPDQLANTDACSLLTASEATSVGLPSQGIEDAAGAHSGCQWNGSDFSVSVGVRTDVGLAGVLLNGGTLTNTTVGTHQAKQVAGVASSGCLVAMGITNSMRVDVGATQVSTGNECQEAMAVAQLVEKRLP